MKFPIGGKAQAKPASRKADSGEKLGPTVTVRMEEGLEPHGGRYPQPSGAGGVLTWANNTP